MSEIKTNQTYVYTGSSEYSFDNIILDNVSGLSLNATRSGNGGINEIPYDGATVTMKTGVIGADSTVKDLQPSMNNKLYYLITDKVYDRSERDTVVSLATEVSVAVVSGKYQGEFVFSNPNNYLNLYLIWNKGIAFGLLSFNENYIYNLLTLLIITISTIITRIEEKGDGRRIKK